MENRYQSLALSITALCLSQVAHAFHFNRIILQNGAVIEFMVDIPDRGDEVWFTDPNHVRRRLAVGTIQTLPHSDREPQPRIPGRRLLFTAVPFGWLSFSWQMNGK